MNDKELLIAEEEYWQVYNDMYWYTPAKFDLLGASLDWLEGEVSEWTKLLLYNGYLKYRAYSY